MSLLQKLKLKDQREIVVLNAPEDFESELETFQGITVYRDAKRLTQVQAALAFVRTDAEISAAADALLHKAHGDPLVYFAYPKAASKRYKTSIDRDSSWTPVLQAGFESTRQISLNADWSLLRFRRSEHTSRVFDPSKITEIRIRRGWNQSELATNAGVSPAWISKLENKRIESPDMYRLQKVADALGTPVTALLVRREQVREGDRQDSAEIIKNENVRAPDSASRLKVFICHASSDKPAARELYHRLKAEHFLPWLDEEDLLPGQNWRKIIPKAVMDAHVVVVCLSRASVTKRGFVQKEIEYALDVASEQPEDTIFIIPVRLEECAVPERLSEWQWVNLYESNGYERLLRALRHRAESLKG